uniref:Uncharacterized protein n=1 Tax=Lepeophtheirus salmonis TaxID=72036 RepID=A0A0K2VKI7_LEPSM
MQLCSSHTQIDHTLPGNVIIHRLSDSLFHLRQPEAFKQLTFRWRESFPN